MSAVWVWIKSSVWSSLGEAVEWVWGEVDKNSSFVCITTTCLNTLETQFPRMQSSTTEMCWNEDSQRPWGRSPVRQWNRGRRSVSAQPRTQSGTLRKSSSVDKRRGQNDNSYSYSESADPLFRTRALADADKFRSPPKVKEEIKDRKKESQETREKSERCYKKSVLRHVLMF